jgi:hypothetical protein
MTYVVITLLLLVRGNDVYVAGAKDKTRIRCVYSDSNTMIATNTNTSTGGSRNGVGQGQPLPGHVHEDGDDQPGLKHHEQQDQRPSEIAMEAKVVDEIEPVLRHEQPSPDHEISLIGCCCPLACAAPDAEGVSANDV